MLRRALIPPLLAAVVALASAKTFPPDLTGIFTYVEGNKPDLCPRTIEHTTFTGSEDEWIMPHNTILHGGQRCNSIANERALTFYGDAKVRAGGSSVPAGLKDLLTTVGQNIDVNFPLNFSSVTAGENYFIGYESVGRFCQGGSKFENGTLAFLFRPFLQINMPIRGYKLFQFLPGRRFLVMVPRFANAVCVYDAPLLPAPSAEVTPADPSDLTPPLLASMEPMVSAEPSGEPAPEPSPVCFPGSAQVELADGSSKRMADVVIGDVVRTGPASFSQVFMFTHRISSGVFSFVRLRTAARREIELSSSHYLYVNGRLTMAGSAKRGDALIGADGEPDRITAVAATRAVGLYNPQTEDGDIVVGGVRASAYTRAVAPRAAHALLAPLRSAYSFLGLATSAADGGADTFAKIVPAGQLIY